MRRLLGLALAAVLAGCGGGGEAPRVSGELARPYAYDPSIPLGLRDLGVVNPSYPVKVHDVSYLSPAGGRVPAFLVVPPGKGPFAGVVFMHGSSGSRFDFLATAVRVARRGCASYAVWWYRTSST